MEQIIYIGFDGAFIATYLSQHISGPMLLSNHDRNEVLSVMSRKITRGDMSLSYRKILLNSILLEMYESGEQLRSAEQVPILSLRHPKW